MRSTLALIFLLIIFCTDAALLVKKYHPFEVAQIIQNDNNIPQGPSTSLIISANTERNGLIKWKLQSIPTNYPLVKAIISFKSGSTADFLSTPVSSLISYCATNWNSKTIIWSKKPIVLDLLGQLEVSDRTGPLSLDILPLMQKLVSQNKNYFSIIITPNHYRTIFLPSDAVLELHFEKPCFAEQKRLIAPKNRLHYPPSVGYSLKNCQSTIYARRCVSIWKHKCFAQYKYDKIQLGNCFGWSRSYCSTKFTIDKPQCGGLFSSFMDCYSHFAGFKNWKGECRYTRTISKDVQICLTWAKTYCAEQS